MLHDQVTCPSCKTVVERGAQFCPTCGKPLATEPKCSSCGNALAPDARFCKTCGKPVSAPVASSPPPTSAGSKNWILLLIGCGASTVVLALIGVVLLSVMLLRTAPQVSPTTIPPIIGAVVPSVAATNTPIIEVTRTMTVPTITRTTTPTRTPTFIFPVTLPVRATATITTTLAPPPPIVLPPCPSSLPAGMLYCDDFATRETTASQWYLGSTTTVDYVWSPYKYTWTVKAKDISTTLFKKGEYDNFAIEVEAQSLGPGVASYGVQLRRSAEGNTSSYYSVVIDSQGRYSMYKRIAGAWSSEIPVTRRPSPLIRTGLNKNLLGVIAQGNTFTIYINRVPVITVTDDAFAKGQVGISVGSGTTDDHASVAFTRVTILTPEQAKAEWGSSQSPAPMSQATTAPVTSSAQATSAPSVPPGVYVTGLRIDPPSLGERMDAGFYVTFRNTTNASQQYRWNVYVFRADDLKYSFGEASSQATTMPLGTVEQRALGSWRIGVGTCGNYVARVAWLDQANNRTYFTKPDGQTFEFPFTVCP